MSGDSEIEALRQLVEKKEATVRGWTDDVESYIRRYENTNIPIDQDQLALRKKAKANAEAELQGLKQELTSSLAVGSITTAGRAAVDTEKREVVRVMEARAMGLGGAVRVAARVRKETGAGGMATRKKYRRRNKRKTNHYKKKTKRYTKKRNMRY